MKKLTFLFLILFISVAEKPAFVITGTVFDMKGDAIAGVTVTEQHTKSSTTTSSEGKYSMSVSGEQSQLVFSHKNFETHKERVGNRRKIDVILSAAKIEVEEDMEISLEMEEHASHGS